MQFVQSDDIGKIHKHRSVNFCTSMFLDSCMFWNPAGNTKNRTSMTLNSFQRLCVCELEFSYISICWSHRYVGGLLGAVPIYVSFRFFFQQECKIACFHSGATWSSHTCYRLCLPLFHLRSQKVLHGTFAKARCGSMFLLIFQANAGPC